MKKALITVIALGFISTSLFGHEPSFGKARLINDSWTFVHNGQQKTVNLPHDWSVDNNASKDLASCTGYLPAGKGEYTKTLNISSSEKGHRQYLYFGAVYCNSEVYVNSQLVGKRPNGYVSFVYDITPYVEFGADNEILVKVDHSKYADSRWYTGSGIYRDVYLISANEIHLQNWGVAVSSYKKRAGATFRISTSVVNDSQAEARIKVRQNLRKKGNKLVLGTAEEEISVPAGTTGVSEQIIELAVAQLWSLESPELYEVETVVLSGKKVLDSTTNTNGVREFRFDPNHGFSLNGKNIKVKGVCLHHDAGSLGAAVPEPVLRSRLIKLKEIGCNAIRTSHNPQAEEFYDICDEIGLLVMDEAFDEWEFPKKKWIEGWNVGENPGKDGYSEHFEEWAETDLASMVMRDRNHACIFLWSIGNEVDYPNDPYSHPILDSLGINQRTVPGYKPELPRAERIGDIAKKLAAVVRSIDTTRAITGAMAGVVMSNCTDYPSILDVAGYNYTENRYNEDHETYPERIIYGSENRHEYQHWCAVLENEHIFGQFLWTGFDYLGESYRYPSRGMTTGLFDLGGFIKPRGEYRKCLWSDQPTVYAGTIRKSELKKGTLMFDLPANWNYKKGEEICVAVMSNCDSVALFINDKLVEGKSEYKRNSNASYWIVPFRWGELKAVGYNDGAAVAEYPIYSFGKADHLKVTADRMKFDGKGDVIQVVLEVLDPNDHLAQGFGRNVECRVTGGAKLLKLENAKSTHTKSFEGNTVPAYRGRVLAYIQATEDNANAHVDFDVPDLDERIRITLKP